MPDPRSVNRSMFWRVLRRSVFANRGRLFVILLALGAGAAITAALLNLQVDAKRRITSDFASFGPNVLMTSRSSGAESMGTIPESLIDQIPDQENGQPAPRASFLYAAAAVTAYSDEGTYATRLGSGPVVLAGVRFRAEDLNRVIPYKLIGNPNRVVLDVDTCEVGEKVASQFHLDFGAALEFQANGKDGGCIVDEIRSFGGPEDSQIFLDLEDAQQLAMLPNRVSVIEISVPGAPSQIAQYIVRLQKKFPDVEVRPVRQFTEGEARLYGRISGILTATVAVVLVLTALCVMAAMTNVAMERKNDVGLMKAIGGSVRRVLRLFLAEAALLGLAGGLIGAAIGIVISIGLGKAVFGVAAQPRLIVYPISVALTVIVAILAAYPLRRLVHIRPAAVFRGEE
jgi:putative ABC transport system permease protein